MVGLTLHSAKGLEFEACVIAGVEEGLIPHDRHATIDDLEEERRLFYVGLTRARTRLLLTVCRERVLWGRPWASGRRASSRRPGSCIRRTEARSARAALLVICPSGRLIAAR